MGRVLARANLQKRDSGSVDIRPGSPFAQVLSENNHQ